MSKVTEHIYRRITPKLSLLVSPCFRFKSLFPPFSLSSHPLSQTRAPSRAVGLFLTYCIVHLKHLENEQHLHTEDFKAYPPLNRMCHIHQIYVTGLRQTYILRVSGVFNSSTR